MHDTRNPPLRVPKFDISKFCNFLTVLDLVVRCIPRPLLGHEPVLSEAKLVLFNCDPKYTEDGGRERDDGIDERGSGDAACAFFRDKVVENSSASLPAVVYQVA